MSTRGTSVPRSSRPGKARLGRALPALLVCVAMALAACAGARDAGTKDPGSGQAAGGTLRVAFSDDTENYDPQQKPQLHARTISRQIADTLTDQDPKTGKILPWLATGWEISKDVRTFTFQLREGVTFSDGTPLDAEAVKANFDRVIKLGPLAYIGAGLLRGYAGSKVVDDHTVAVSFKEPNAQFLQATSTQSLSILAPATLKLKPEDVARGKVIGSGPYVLESYDPNKGIRLKARKDYAWPSPIYTSGGKPAYDRIEITFVKEPTTIAGALTSGQIDYAYLLDPASVSAVKSSSAHLVQTPMPAISIPIVPLVHRKITADADVRRALSLATDREAIVSTVFQGRYRPATGVLTKTNPGYVDLSGELTYDPEAAKALLDKAGWSRIGEDGIRRNAAGERLSLEIQYETPSQYEAMFQLLQRQWAKVGVEFRIKPVADLSDYTIDTYPFDLTTWSQTRADPDVLRTVYSSFYKDQSFLYGHADPEVDELLGRLQSAVYPKLRLKISGQVQRLILQRGYTVPLFDLIQFAGSSGKLEGVHTDIEGKPLFVDFRPR